jgi:Mor family transcriptional regulator
MPDQGGGLGYPELLEDLRTGLQARFEELGLTPMDAARVALAATEHIRKNWGGIQLYVPRAYALKLAERDMAIFAEFDGCNKRRETCRKYGISEAHLYRIYNRVRASIRGSNHQASQEEAPNAN